MEERFENLFSMLKREPEQTQLLLKLGLGAPLVIVLLQALGEFVFPKLVVALVALGVTLVYGGTLAVLVARLVQSSGRREVEASQSAQRLMDHERRRAATVPSPARPPATRTPATGSFPATSAEASTAGQRGTSGVEVAAADPPPLLSDAIAAVEASQSSPPRFHEVFFLLRLTADVQRARREASNLSVLVLDVNLSKGRPEAEQLDVLSYDLAKAVFTLEGQISYPLQLGPAEFAFYLKNTGREKAQTFMRPFIQALSDYWVHFGLAVYPEDGTQPEQLLEAARESLAAPAPAPDRRGLLGSLLHRGS